ncbi:ABC transporter ATP-binding protein [Pseudoroseomonas rhizosphaerae]|uniref:ABC transporter ATP-binding protein n=1 Tax=Teichococcus rhizosphaerae TaxID=1335062 RepID=A0A2C7AB92_9PROT|nr:ATP-binding cassette domain-containing protein [Pseudoroseomonas rhizosphaerae]PHK94356.1 ABC transporter ATP-binding protein [Pseudoroseomonas rhizosphaerae]
MSAPALSARGLARHYGGVAALRGVDLDLVPGEICGLIGPNGAGKSTLVDVLSGRAPGSGGSVRLFGQDITGLGPAARRHAGLARSFQRTSIFPALPVGAQLDLALVGPPRVLLLDEPAAGLTAEESLALADRLRELARARGVTVLLVEHDMEVVFRICERITVLELGALLAEGTPQEIRRHPEVVRAYLGSAAA